MKLLIEILNFFFPIPHFIRLSIMLSELSSYVTVIWFIIKQIFIADYNVPYKIFGLFVILMLVTSWILNYQAENRDNLRQQQLERLRLRNRRHIEEQNLNQKSGHSKGG